MRLKREDFCGGNKRALAGFRLFVTASASQVHNSFTAVMVNAESAEKENFMRFADLGSLISYAKILNHIFLKKRLTIRKYYV